MNALSLSIDGEPGYLFEATHHRDDIVFVPAAVLSECYEGVAEFDPGAYVRSGWAAKNARFNSGETSEYAFPVLDCPILRADERRVALFLQRLRHAYAVELATDCVN
jgi:hypothetical protein